MAMVHLDQHYVDPRLVALYDLANPRGADGDFYIQLAADLQAHTILDLGCGTGLLTREFAIDDRQVIGIDPAPAMLAVARRKPDAERVQWIEGDSSALGTPNADLVVMTGNVAQVFLDDTDWATTLHNIYAALRPGGYLAFESRNPEARAWEQWTRDATYTQSVTPDGPLEEWLEVVSVHDGCVRMEGHNVFTATGEVLVVPSELYQSWQTTGQKRGGR
jgi:SAM-dependent methyltransferase